MGMADTLAQELDREGATTRKLLERVPSDKLSWKPHAKSMTLGELANHVASIPGRIASWATKDSFDFSTMTRHAPLESTEAICTEHDAMLLEAKSVLSQLGDAGLMTEWEGQMKGATIFKMPKVALFRNIVLNHWIHHRGQLSVYLRLLDVPVPSIYGPSADDNPFAPR